jgi:hypothetical protein
MRTLKLLSVALLAVSLGRGVRLLRPAPGEMPATFDPAQSAALVVGVRDFSNDLSLGQVRYTVDDAINLAAAFALDARTPLVEPRRVVLALAGQETKKASKEQLQRLKDAGAVVTIATKSEIENALARQAASVGSGGVLIVGFATHGFSSDGATYVMASSSVYTELETSIPTAKILEVAATAPRSLLFFDACREQRGTRATPLPPPFVEGLTRTAGQVVFSISGPYAYEHPHVRNGAFTAAVVAGLQCKAKKDAHGFVTVDTLADYVEKRLRTWLVKNREPDARTAIRVTTDGDSDAMPLTVCPGRPSSSPISPARAEVRGQTLIAFDARGAELWRLTLPGSITPPQVADLDGDRANEVVTIIDGKLVVFRPDGEQRWTADTNVPPNYDFPLGNLRVFKFVIGEVYQGKRQHIVALSADTNGSPWSRLSIFDSDGLLLGGFFHPGRLRTVTIAARTPLHDPRIIVTGINRVLYDKVGVRGNLTSVFMLDPDKVEGEAPPYLGKLGFGTQVWYGYLRDEAIERLEIVDRDNDGKHDISLWTSNGHLSLDFDGRTIKAKNAQFVLVK